MFLFRVHCIVLIFFGVSGVLYTKFSRCGAGGFTCVTNPKTKNQAITYQCPNGTDDVSFSINIFNSPTNTESFTIKNCDKLTISTRCTSNSREIKSLSIQNVNQLIIERSQYTSHLPPAVLLENIGFLETIPSFTFAQIAKSTLSSGCYIPKADFDMITMKNMTIDTMQANAIYLKNNSRKVIFDQVKINRMQNSAMNIELQQTALFSLTHSTVDIVEHLGFQIVGKDVKFIGNKFVDVASSGINGTIQNFVFTNNIVNTLQPQSISILAENVNISKNRFEYLKSGAFEKIGPGLLRDSGKNFGKLRFVYDFRDNVISFTDAASLHPDMISYDNVATDMNVEGNKLYCSCENLGWLFSGTGHGYNTETVSGFYEYILNPHYQNNCTLATCHLSVSSMNKSIKDQKCMENFDVKDLCMTHTTTPVPTTLDTSKPVTGKKYKTVSRMFLVRSVSQVILASNALILFLGCILVATSNAYY